MQEDCAKQLHSHGARHVFELAVMAEAHTAALDSLRVTKDERLMSADTVHTESVMRLKDINHQDMSPYNITYNCDDGCGADTNDVPLHSGVHDRKQDDSVTSLRNIQATGKTLKEDSNRSAGDRNAEQIAARCDTRGQGMIMNGSGDMSDLMKLKAKLEAVGLEIAHTDSRCLTVPTARVREEEDVFPLRHHFEGRRADELLCLSVSADVSGRLEVEIDRLRGEYTVLGATVRELPSSITYSIPSSIPPSIPSSIPSSFPTSIPSSFPLLGVRTGTGSASVVIHSPPRSQSPTCSKGVTQGGVEDDESKYHESNRGMQGHILIGESCNSKPVSPSCALMQDMKVIRKERDEYKDLFQIGGEYSS